MAGGLDTSITDGWLSSIPPGWSLNALRWNSWVRARLGWRGLTAAEYVTEGVPLLSTPDIKTPDINYSGANRVTWERYEESPEIKLSNGDVLLTKDGATIGIVNLVADLPEPATVNGSIAVITPGKELSGRYLRYCLSSEYAQQMMALLQGGMGVPHLFQADIKRMRIPLPPLAEQRAIADYLDRETLLIDQLIERQNAFIERLRERRSGLILTAVTGAAEQERKPANLGWADSVPTSWDILPLAYLARITLGKMVAPTPSSDRAVLAPYLRAANVQPDGATAFDDLKEMWFEPGELRALTVEAGDVVVVEGGQGGFGRAAFVQDDLLGVGFQNSINRLRPRGSDGRFLAYALIAIRATGYMHAYCDAVSMPHLTAEKLARLRIGAPSLDEQRTIADYLDRETPKIDDLISKVERHIELAKERRSALITAAVTGQTKVGAA